MAHQRLSVPDLSPKQNSSHFMYDWEDFKYTPFASFLKRLRYKLNLMQPLERIELDDQKLQDLVAQSGSSRLVHLVSMCNLKKQYIGAVGPNTSVPMVCRICEQTFSAHLMHIHSDNCYQKTTLNQKLLDTTELVKDLLEKAQSKELEYNTQINLSMKRSRRSSMNLAPTLGTKKLSIFSKQDSFISIEAIKESNSNSPQNELLNIQSSSTTDPQKPKSIYKRARTITLNEEKQSKNSSLMSYQSPLRQGIAKQQIRSHGHSQSPDSQQDTKQLRQALNTIKQVITYCKQVLQDTLIGSNKYLIDEIHAQSQLRMSLLDQQASDVYELVQQSLKLIEERIELGKKINKIQQVLNNDQSSLDSLKRSFQKKQSSSFNQKTSSRKLLSIRVFDKQAVSQTLKSWKVITSDPIIQLQQCRKNSAGDSSSLSYVNEKNLKCNDKFNSHESIDSNEKYGSFDMINFEDNEDNEEDQRGFYSDSEVQERKKSGRSNKIIEVGLKDFEFLEVLGVGAFGAVWKVRKIKTDDVYALKVIDTKSKTNKNFFESLQKEKSIFEVIEGEFVAKAFYSFTSGECVFFVLEYLKGGDFGRIIQEYGALDEWIAQFYLAEIVLAIETLHNLSIIHRDLKPENILIDDKGHIRLADFGLSEVGLSNKIKNTSIQTSELEAHRLQKNLEENIQVLRLPSNIKKPYRTPPQSMTPAAKNRIIGTPDYIAPEVIRGQSISNPSLDWWSFGVLVYEFLIGIPPFNDESPELIFKNILSGQITWPSIGYNQDQISPEAYDLITKLLVEEPQRLNVNEIKSHPFFKGINWKGIRKQKAPINPDEVYSSEPEKSSPEIKKKQRERQKLVDLLSNDRATSPTNKLKYLKVDNLMRLDLLVELNKQKAEEILQKQKFSLSLKLCK